jgi:hypothetical protein
MQHRAEFFCDFKPPSPNHNPEVAGSNPAPATRKINDLQRFFRASDCAFLFLGDKLGDSVCGSRPRDYESGVMSSNLFGRAVECEHLGD